MRTCWSSGTERTERTQRTCAGAVGGPPQFSFCVRKLPGDLKTADLVALFTKAKMEIIDWDKIK